MLRFVFASAVICAVVIPAVAEEAAPDPQVVIVPGEVAEPTELPQNLVTYEAAIPVPAAAASKSGCRGQGSTVYLTN